MASGRGRVFLLTRLRAVRRDAGGAAGHVGSQYHYMGNEDDGGLMDFGAPFYDPRVSPFVNPIKTKK